MSQGHPDPLSYSPEKFLYLLWLASKRVQLTAACRDLTEYNTLSTVVSAALGGEKSVANAERYGAAILKACQDAAGPTEEKPKTVGSKIASVLLKAGAKVTR